MVDGEIFVLSKSNFFHFKQESLVLPFAHMCHFEAFTGEEILATVNDIIYAIGLDGKVHQYDDKRNTWKSVYL